MHSRLRRTQKTQKTQNSRTTKGRRALGGHELRGRVAKGLASMLWDTCKTVVCLFWLFPLWLHFQIPINGILFSWSRSTFPSVPSFTAGHDASSGGWSGFSRIYCCNALAVGWSRTFQFDLTLRPEHICRTILNVSIHMCKVSCFTHCSSPVV